MNAKLETESDDGTNFETDLYRVFRDESGKGWKNESGRKSKVELENLSCDTWIQLIPNETWRE